MSRRVDVHALAALATAAVVLWAPALGWASSGGGGLQGSVSTTATNNSKTVVKATGGTITAGGNGITLVSQSSGFLGGRVRFTGTVQSADAGAVVEIERLGHQTGWKWAPTAHARAARNGSFTTIWRANHIGRFAIRAVITSPGAPDAAAVSPTVATTVYRLSLATLFGPGLWGNGTACGEVLKRTTIGVANRTLKCGTPVAIYYHGRIMVVPVIDRGPYANGADWDLTMATAAALGMDGTDTIGAVSLPPEPSWLAPQLTG